MYTTPEEGSRRIEQNLPGFLGHLLHTNSNFAVPAVRLLEQQINLVLPASDTANHGLPNFLRKAQTLCTPEHD